MDCKNTVETGARDFGIKTQEERGFWLPYYFVHDINHPTVLVAGITCGNLLLTLSK